MDERRGADVVLVGKPQEKTRLGTSWLRKEDNIKIDLQEGG
jgi:hypothetical protein